MKTNSFKTKATLLLVSSLTVMSGATIAPALPSMQNHFADVESVAILIRFVLTTPALFIVIAAPLAGIFVDRLGRRPLMMPAVILYGIAGSSGLYLESLGMIIVGRGLLGIAVAGVMTTTTTLIADYYEGAIRAQVMGWQAAFMSLGGMVFLISGGFLADISWRLPFMIYLFAFLLIPMVLLYLPEPEIKQGQTVNIGTLKKSPGLQQWILPGFIYGVLFLASTIFYIIPLQIPFYLELEFGTGASATGMAIAISTLFSVFTSFSYGRIRSRFGYVTILGITFALYASGFVLIGLANSYPVILAGLAFCGLGMGLIYPNMNMWLTSETPVAIRGRAVSGFTTAIFLGQFLSPVSSQPMVDLFGLQMMFLSIGLFWVLMSVGFFLFRRAILGFATHSVNKLPQEVEPKRHKGTKYFSIQTNDQK